MTNTDTRDVQATVRQIKDLEAAGCDIVRVAVPDLEAARAIADIKNRYPFHWWQISILIMSWRWKPLRRRGQAPD